MTLPLTRTLILDTHKYFLFHVAQHDPHRGCVLSFSHISCSVTFVHRTVTQQTPSSALGAALQEQRYHPIIFKRSFSNVMRGSAFVNTSADWSPVATFTTRISPLLTKLQK